MNKSSIADRHLTWISVASAWHSWGVPGVEFPVAVTHRLGEGQKQELPACCCLFALRLPMQVMCDTWAVVGFEYIKVRLKMYICSYLGRRYPDPASFSQLLFFTRTQLPTPLHRSSVPTWCLFRNNLLSSACPCSAGFWPQVLSLCLLSRSPLHLLHLLHLS